MIRLSNTSGSELPDSQDKVGKWCIQNFLCLISNCSYQVFRNIKRFNWSLDIKMETSLFWKRISCRGNQEKSRGGYVLGWWWHSCWNVLNRHAHISFTHQILLECLLCARDCSRYLRLMSQVNKHFYCCSSRKDANHVINKHIKCYVKSDTCYRKKKRKCKGEYRGSGMRWKQ